MITRVETIPAELEFARRAREAMVALQECVEVSPEVLGGVPVLRGTRFSVPQLFAELADSSGLAELADDFELDPALLQRFLHALAVYLDKPVSP
jgi:uncharacterized protein (DUF433 family)